MLFPLTSQLSAHPASLKSPHFDFEKSTGTNIKPVAGTTVVSPHSQLQAPAIEAVKKMTGGVVSNISVVTNNVAMPHISTQSNTSPGATGSDDGYRTGGVGSHNDVTVDSVECGSMGGMNCESGGSPTPPQTLTLRLIMQGKEVGSIIGKRGDTIKKFRTESGARINISDGQSIERIVTLTGANECLNKAFAMISYKFEEDMSEGLTADCPKPPVTLRLIVPASQCGSIIGKGGSKIKEIREHTGCTIQVAGDFLPQSTERAVTISGMPEAITKCIMEICKIMAESPPKGQTIPYRPKPISSIVTGSPIIANGHPSVLGGGAGLGVGGHPGLTGTPGAAFSPGVPMAAANNFLSTAYGLHPAAANHSPQFLPTAAAQSTHELAKLQAAQLSSLYGSFLQPTTAMMHLGAAAAASPSAALSAPFAATSSTPTVSQANHVAHSSNTTQELSIPNDVIGCVIGPHGNRINDIRNSSGASIKISPMREGSGPNRTVTVTGTPEAVVTAWNQIASSLGLDPASLAAGLFSTGAYGNPTGHANPVNPLANPTSALAALNPGLTNQMLAQLLAANPATSLSLAAANFTSPTAAVAASLAPSSVGSMNNLVSCQPGSQSPSSNNFAAAAAAMTGTNLVNVIRPNFTNLKKARSEAAPY